MTVTLEERSHAVCDAANQAAGNGPGWNGRFRAEVARHGFEIVPIVDGRPLAADNADAPLYARSPYDGDDNAWPWPSVVAPIGWKQP